MSAKDQDPADTKYLQPQATDDPPGSPHHTPLTGFVIGYPLPEKIE